MKIKFQRNLEFQILPKRLSCVLMSGQFTFNHSFLWVDIGLFVK